ncbi:hypothetical protein Tco_0530874 [Tanacetum coccineum]
MSTPTQCWLWYHGIGWFSLLLTSLCFDDTHDITPRVSALAGCDRLEEEEEEEEEQGKEDSEKKGSKKASEIGSNSES